MEECSGIGMMITWRCRKCWMQISDAGQLESGDAGWKNVRDARRCQKSLEMPDDCLEMPEERNFEPRMLRLGKAVRE